MLYDCSNVVRITNSIDVVDVAEHGKAHSQGYCVLHSKQADAHPVMAARLAISAYQASTQQEAKPTIHDPCASPAACTLRRLRLPLAPRTVNARQGLALGTQANPCGSTSARFAQSGRITRALA